MKSVTLTDECAVVKIPCLFYGRSVTSVIQNPLPIIRTYKPLIVISEGAPSYLTLWILLFLRSFYRYRLIIWSHGIKFNELNSAFRNFRGKIQLWLFNRADAVLLYSDRRSDILKGYINDPTKVFVARNTLDTNHLRVLYKKLEKSGKEKIKRELGFMTYFNLVYIGRLLENKGVSDLLDAYGMLRKDFNIALHIIGDGPEIHKLEEASKGSLNVHFYGAVFDPELTGKILYASDLMVIPGYIGLSVIHAFAFGCPVVTYMGRSGNSPIHSPEVEYITENKNGVFCDPGPSYLVSAIRKLLNEPGRLEKMSRNAIKTAYHDASIENMLQGFRSVISFLGERK